MAPALKAERERVMSSSRRRASGHGSGERFDRLLDAIDAFASARNAEVETGVSLACEDAFRRMRSHGFRMITLGVAMHSPHGKTFNRPGAYILGDWR